MGQYGLAHAGRLGAGRANRLARETPAHHGRRMWFRLSFWRLCAAPLRAMPFLAEVAPITGPMYQLFIFFMITDPKTTVKTRWGQCLVAFLVAAVEMALAPRSERSRALLRAGDCGPAREYRRDLVDIAQAGPVGARAWRRWPQTGKSVMEQYIERVVDLLDPGANRIYNLTADAARELLAGSPGGGGPPDRRFFRSHRAPGQNRYHGALARSPHALLSCQAAGRPGVDRGRPNRHNLRLAEGGRVGRAVSSQLYTHGACPSCGGASADRMSRIPIRSTRASSIRRRRSCRPI